MIIRLIKYFCQLAADAKGSICPRCKGNNTDRQGNIWHCYDCGHEW